MAGTTPTLALPYPDAADTVDIPRDVKALVDKLDPLVNKLTLQATGALAQVAGATTANNGVFALWPSSALTIAKSGQYIVFTGPITIKNTAAGRNDIRLRIFKGGAGLGRVALYSPAATSDSTSLMLFDVLALVAGDVIDLRYSTNNLTADLGALGANLVALQIG